ncbi:MAG TPA: cytochrome c oxidase assembly protein [Burkholderiaceae bacterium]|nr:cytochrome c oxidase assembly protein [Burkholderiaceae bacterium]
MAESVNPGKPAAQPRAPDVRRSNLQVLGKLLVLTVVMFGFGFALVPLYRAICELTGINVATQRDAGAAEFARNTQVDASRTIVVEFDANHQGAWLFRPERPSVTVHPGELVTVQYELVNTQPRAMAGQAIPSYAPLQSTAFFRKLECFCFQQQTLAPNETRRFPVVFVIDPKLPREVATITLSYTFFEVAGATAAGAAAPVPARPGG